MHLSCAHISLQPYSFELILQATVFAIIDGLPEILYYQVISQLVTGDDVLQIGIV